MSVSTGEVMPKVSLDIPSELLIDIKNHVGDEKKFISLADAIRTACRKMLDQLDTIDEFHGRR
jgi:Arc/MetJ-type ribon-helix-helix transcriptional regulator